MKERKAFEAWALPLLRKYQKALLLEDHNLTFEYDEEKVSRSGAVMIHLFHYPYKTLAINYGNQALTDFKEGEKEELRRTLIHELCHSITDPLYNYAHDRYVTKDVIENERERVTDHIANVVAKIV